MAQPFISSSHDVCGDGDQTSKASSSSTLPQPQVYYYDVFLSFRGEDTRYGFTDHLYRALDNRGILVFRDNEHLHVGEKIDRLFEAIKGSKISIPIISPDYASSKWCLMELVQIIECKKTMEQTVLPIFYDVEPSHVRKPEGNFRKKFQLSCRKDGLDGQLVNKLKDAFKEVASLKGWESKKIADGYEGGLVETVVKRVLEVLGKAALPVSDHLIGVENHVEKIIEWTANTDDSSGVKAIVIHGMSGVGKTTLAKVIYNRLCKNFDRCSFIENVSETSSQKGLAHLQKQLISDLSGEKEDIANTGYGENIIKARCKGKKVLVLLDDVDHRDQLKALAGKPDWFRTGSIIIITSKKKDVLEKWELNFPYELNILDAIQSVQLFRKHAFKENESHLDERGILAKKIAKTTAGLPLAIEVIGSSLHGKEIGIWKDTLESLQHVPHDDVLKKLKISFDALCLEEKEIFLDAACLPFDSGRLAIYMWEGSDIPKRRIKNLVSMSMIKLSKDNKILIHDQLRDLGRYIVGQENIYNRGNRSRIWKEEDARLALELNLGNSQVQALNLGFDETSHCNSRQFEGMTNLRFLRMRGVFLEGDFENLFQNLRWLEWCNSMRQSRFDFMGFKFNPIMLVVLILHNCNITNQWSGWSQMEHLKALMLSDCPRITTTPDFPKHLKYLRLRSCHGLTTISDLSALELEFLYLDDCGRLKEIHPSIGESSKTLQILDVGNCYRLEELPIQVGKMEELRKLILDDTSMEEIPITEGYMAKLERISAVRCFKLTWIPDSIGSLTELQSLNLRGCAKLTEIPSSIGELKLLTELDLSSTKITQLPGSIGGLWILERLHLSYTPIVSLPISIKMLRKLQELDLYGCDKLALVPDLPYSLSSLTISGKSLKTLPNFSNLKNLSSLELVTCPELMKLYGLEEAVSLTSLKIRWCEKLFNLSGIGISVTDLILGDLPSLQSLPNLSTAKKMKKLYISKCSKLVEIRGLEKLERIQSVVICNCSFLERMGDLSLLKLLTALQLCNCERLRDVQGIEKLKSLMNLAISKCHPEFEFPDLQMLSNLVQLRIMDDRIKKIEGLQELKSLEQLDISGCRSLQCLPDLSRLKNLRELFVYNCVELTEIQGLENLLFLQLLGITGCIALQKLLDLPKVCILDEEDGSESGSCQLEDE